MPLASKNKYSACAHLCAVLSHKTGVMSVSHNQNVLKRGKSYNKAASKDRFSDERLFGNAILKFNFRSPKVPGFFEIGMPRP